VNSKKGWIQHADNGILVLEEIGDLPRETQANLLTFVETGKFHKVGSTRTQKAHVRIIAATNRQENLRTDFHSRFFSFYIPPLYKRREDILYYLAHKFPDLPATLAPWEVMVLLAYNWPGNVREIEQLGRMLMSWKKSGSENASPEIAEDALNLVESEIFALPAANSAMHNAEFKNAGLCAIDYKSTALKGYKVYQLYNDLKNSGIDVQHLETLFNRFNMGLTINNDTCPFGHFKDPDSHAGIVMDKRFDVALCPSIDAFTSAYLGIQAFCALFWSNVKENTNLLDIPKTAFTVPFSPINRFFKLTSRNIALFGDISAYINKNKRNASKQSAAHIKKNKINAPPQTQADIFNLSHTELMKLYFGGLLKRTGGNQAKAARMTGLKYTTFRQKLNKFKVV